MEGDAEGIRDMMRKSTARRKLFDKEKPEPAEETSGTEKGQPAEEVRSAEEAQAGEKA